VSQEETIVRESFSRQAFMRTLGAEITGLGHGKIEIRLGFQSALTQQNGFIHAGVLTSIMDSACGYAAMSVGPEKHDVLSVEFKVNLLAPARGDYFLARAAVKRPGRNLTVCTADAFAVQNGREKLVTTMLATMMNVKPSAG
jgi:uncharacterized protein (TIGR00369 family)